MKQIRFSDLPTSSQVNEADVFPIIQNGDNKKAQQSSIKDYSQYKNIPKVNGRALSGDVTLDELGAQAPGEYLTEKELLDADLVTKVENANKADKNYGAENSGKYLGTDENGEIAPIDVKFSDDNKIIKTVRGNPTIINDSSDLRLQKLNIYGQSKQDNTNGYQLFDASKLQSSSSSGATVTNNGDGSFTVSGEGNLTDFFRRPYFDYSKEETKKLLKVGTLYGKVELDIFPAVGFLIYSNGDWTELNLIGNRIRSIEITEDMLNADDLFCRIRFYGNNGSLIKTGTIKPMFWQDGDGTWEKYTGGKSSPSVDYPQEIISKEVSEIKVTGKNLLDFTKVHKINSIKNPYTMLENGYILRRDENNINDRISVFPCELKKGQTYSINFDSNFIVGEEEVIAVYLPKLTQYIERTRPFVPNEDTNEIGIYLAYLENAPLAQVEITNIQLEYGSEFTSYEPYKEQTITLPEPITLRGISVTSDGNVTIDGQQYISDVIKEKDGVIGVERNCKYISTHEVENIIYGKHSNGNGYLGLNDIKSKKDIINMCDRYIGSKWTDKSGYFYSPNNTGIIIVDDRFTDEETAKNLVNQENPNILYVLVSPTFEPLPQEIQEQYKALKSYYPNTVIQTGCWNETEYEVSLQSFVEDMYEKIKEVNNNNNKLLL